MAETYSVPTTRARKAPSTTGSTTHTRSGSSSRNRYLHPLRCLFSATAFAPVTTGAPDGNQAGAVGVLVRLPGGDVTDGVQRAQTTGSITVSPDGNDVYVGSNTSLRGRGVDEEAWITGFPVASVVTPAQPATPVFSAPTAPGLSVQLRADDGPPVAMTMSPDGKRLVLATAQAIASPAATGTVLYVFPVTSSAPGRSPPPRSTGARVLAVQPVPQTAARASREQRAPIRLLRHRCNPRLSM